MDFGGTGWDAVDLIHLAHYRDEWQTVLNTVMNLRVIWKTGYFLISWVTVSVSRRTPLHGGTHFVG